VKSWYGTGIVLANRLQLQIRCAVAEEKAEDLQLELQALIGRDYEGKIAILQKELGVLRTKLAKAKAQEEHSEHTDLNESIQKENGILRRASKKREEKLGKVNSDCDRIKRAARMDEDIMVGLKNRLETAESELENLKRKRTDSISLERVITGILKRPAAPSPSGQNVPSSSAQPTPKKSRNRKNR
jgi:hypothetical protein